MYPVYHIPIVTVKKIKQKNVEKLQYIVFFKEILRLNSGFA